MGIDRTALTEAVVRTYLDNYNVVDALAHKYGFKYAFFWPAYSQLPRVSHSLIVLFVCEARASYAIQPIDARAPAATYSVPWTGTHI
jgi:hypothetical protein